MERRMQRYCAAGITALLFSCGLLAVVADPTEPASTDTEITKTAVDPTVLKSEATKVIQTSCVSCHNAETQEGEVRLDALDTIDPVDLQKLLANIQEVVQLREMPPADADQPTQAERKVLLDWVIDQQTGETAKALAEKLLRFEYGNVVEHEELFSGKHAHLPGYTYDRRWVISEFIFNEKVNKLLDYHPTRRIYGRTQQVAGDSGVHWSPKSERGNKFRRTIANPFLLPKRVGVRYSAHEPLTAGHLLTMLGNAKRIAGHMTSESTMKSQYPAMYELMQTEFEHRKTLQSREAFLTQYGVMDHVLKEIYGDKHAAMLPKVQLIDMPYPKPRMEDGKVKIETNLGLLGRQDRVDLNAVYRAIHAYYDDGIDYDRVIAQAQREWLVEGVVASRIRNRVGLMKAFKINWDFDRIVKKALGDRYRRPAYKPLNDAEMAEIVATIKKHRKPGDTYQDIIDKCMAHWRASLRAERDAMPAPDDELLIDLVTRLYDKVYEREPTDAEIEKNLAMLESFMDKVDRQESIAKLVESLILNTEFVYRNEFGVGEADEHGRRMMSPRDASYALAYALTDSSPDVELVKAAEEGRLNTREDYQREVRRMLARRDRWTIIDEAVQAAGLNASVTNQPIRKLRFFREFFGYPKAMDVFKDNSRFGAGNKGAGNHQFAVSRLIDEADLLVEHILEQDERVFETLLTTEKFYVFHSGDNEVMQRAADNLKAFYEYFKDYDWESWGPADLFKHKDFLVQTPIKGGQAIQSGEDNGTNRKAIWTFQRQMKSLSHRFGAGQENAVPFLTLSFGFWHAAHFAGRTGQQMRGEEVTSYWNIDWRTWDYPTHQPAKIPNRKGMLTHPAWLIAHAQNLETDPIHRGKWVREKLLAGTIPDVPITVDAVIPPDKDMTMRQRMEDRTGAQACWRCHQKMDPLGFPFESFDDFGRFRTEENLEHPENLIKEKPAWNASIEALTYGAHLPVYKTKPVDPRGVLKGTDDSALDGDVDDAFDLIDRLAKSDKVRQSIIRHAFRYFMGRNETLSDSKTLIDAERAYLDSNGSFDEVIVSLLTSDSFIYRKPHSKD